MNSNNQNNITPQISIIFPSYNGKEHIIRTLNSIENLINLNEIELIIVDNNSSDSSKELIKSLKNLNIKLIEQDKNLGFAKACNIGVSFAKGKYIFITNQDVIFPRDFFTITLNLFNNIRNEQEIILCPAIIFTDNRINYFGAEIHFLGFSYTKNMYLEIPKDKYTFKTLKMSGCSAFLKRKTYLRLNGFDPFFFMYHEDTDFSLKALRNGIPIYTTNETTLDHQKYHMGLNDFTYYYIERNRYLVLIKNLSDLKSLIPQLLISELVLLFQAFLINKLKLRFKIYKFLIQNRKTLLTLRRHRLNCQYKKLKRTQLSNTLGPVLLGPSEIKGFSFLLKIINFILK